MYFIRFPKNIESRLKALGKLADYNTEFVENVNEEVAREYYKRIISHIDKQDLNWTPLKDYYLEGKKSAGLSPKIWEATGHLKEHIDVIKMDNGMWFVGIEIGRAHV